MVVRRCPTTDKVIVDGVNVAKRHSKPARANQQGGIIDKDMPIDVATWLLVARGQGHPRRLPASTPTAPRSASRRTVEVICMSDTTTTDVPRLKAQLPRRDPRPSCRSDLGLGNVMQVPGSRRS